MESNAACSSLSREGPPVRAAPHQVGKHLSSLCILVAAAIVLAMPAGSAAQGQAGAFVPQSLLDAAAAQPDAKFSVIVQGRPSSSAGAVASSVRQEEANHEGNEHGVRRQFNSISAVSAQLTGRQITWLSLRTSIVAITPDAPLKPSLELAPVNVVAPSVAGTAEPGATLTASPGTWTALSPTFAYQWLVCNGACADVAGATGGTYVVQSGDAGHTLAVRVTATDSGGTTSAQSGPTATVTVPAPPPPPLAPPTSLAPPLLSGTAEESSTLTATDGLWADNGPLTVTRQWQRCNPECADVAGAVATTYVLGTADVDATIRVVVTATGTGGAASSSSQPTAVVTALPPLPPVAPAVQVAPSIGAAPQVGVTLTASLGLWSGDAPLRYAVTWQRCTPECTDVADGETYVPTLDDVGATLRARVTGSNAAGSSVAESEQTPAVPAPMPVAPTVGTPPSIEAAPQVGVELTASLGSWSGDAPLAYDVVWQSCTTECTEVATTQSYVPAAGDVGATLRVVVTASNGAGSAVATSEPSAVVAAAPPWTPPLVPPAVETPPAIEATPQQGVELTASLGSWSGEAPMRYAVTWQRCTADCADVGSGETYVPSSDDVGATLRVHVTVSNAVGSSEATSAPSAVVEAQSPVGPAVVTPPSITVTPQEGVELSASPGEWSGDAPFQHGYLWLRCKFECSVVGQSETYLPTADDVGGTLRVFVSATNGGGSTGAISAASHVVLPAVPVSVDLPLVEGSKVAESTLTASEGTWTSTGTTEYAYQWQRCTSTGCADIEGDTAATHVASSDDIGLGLRVVVTATNAGGSTSATSETTVRIAPYSASGFWSWQVGPYAAHADALWDANASEIPAIAVVDSGVDGSLPGLEGVVARQVTMTSLEQASSPDGYGHGSFVASVAAGHGPGEAGAAPGARIVSLDVMNDAGMAMTSDVIAAADWIYQHKAEDNIRVANFSLLGSTPSTFQYDPLDKALERLWLSGVVVVTAAGNYAVDGASSDIAFAPANDPFLITVGAADVVDTVPVGDDVAAPWSAWGHTLDGFAKPEVGAPGRYVVAPVPLDSTLYQERPDRIVAPGRMQLSGTSFAAPLVAGIAADLLAAHPTWTPDQVKGALMLTAVGTTAATPHALGVGEVDAGAARDLADPPNPNAALEEFLIDDPAGGPTQVFDAASWGTTVEANASWGTASWGTASWGTASWGTASWGTTYWSSASWGTASWGTSAQAVDNAADDLHGGGGYWRWGGN